MIFRALAEQVGVGERFVVTSRGTGPWHAGEQANAKSRAALAAAGYDGETHRARQIDGLDISESDLLVALDRGHERFLLENGADRDRVVRLTAYDPERPEDPDVFDPYYSGQRAFDEVLLQVERSCRELLAELAR